MKISCNTIALIVLNILIATSEIVYSQVETNLRFGAGAMYSRPISHEFKHIAGNGRGISVYAMQKLGKTWDTAAVFSLSYIQYERPQTREEDYYQVVLSAYVPTVLIRGLRPGLGCDIVGFHNWSPKPTSYTKYYVGGYQPFYYFPFTIYSFGLSYEYFFLEDISVDLSIKYSFNLWFSRTSWQLSLFTIFL